MDIQAYKKELDQYYDEKAASELWEMAQDIHAHPELGFKEYHACQLQVDWLKKEGFEVEEKAGGLDTAFVAKYGSGKPVVAILSEYDALPELGHACGHNIISTSALGAGFIAKKFLEDSKHEGTILVMGTPAEEGGGGKIIMLKNGCFEGVDAVITQHPTTEPTRLSGDCLSSYSLDIEFFGKAAHAGSHPDQGINALSAAQLYMNGISFWRQHFKRDWTCSSIICDSHLVSGIIPDHVTNKTAFRCFSLKDLRYAIDYLKNMAECCAKALGCTVKIEEHEGYQGRISNKVLSDVCRKEYEDLGEPLMDGMPIDYGGEDLGNVSRVIPSCQPFGTLFPDYKISGHSPKFCELSNSPAAKHCLDVSSKAMGRSCMEYILHPEIIAAAKEELAQRMKNE